MFVDSKYQIRKMCECHWAVGEIGHVRVMARMSNECQMSNMFYVIFR